MEVSVQLALKGFQNSDHSHHSLTDAYNDASSFQPVLLEFFSQNLSTKHSTVTPGFKRTKPNA
jgi:hypothetical protein